MIEAVRVTSAYRAITTSRTALGHIAMVLGYKSKRTLDAQLKLLLDTSSSKLRADPLSCAEAAKRLTAQLTIRDARKIIRPAAIPQVASNGTRSLKLVANDTSKRNAHRDASGDK